MRSISAELEAHFQGKVLTLATCWKLKLSNGDMLGFTDNTADITFDLGDGDGDLLYQAATGYDRSAIKGEVSLDVGGLEVQGLLDSSAINAADLRAGLYDYAELWIFAVNYKDLTMGPYKIAAGRLGQVSLHGLLYVAQVETLVGQLQRPILRTYTPDCDADLGDSRCNFALTPTAGTVLTVTDLRTFVANVGFAEPSLDFFNGGVLVWTSGPNNGRKIEVKKYTQASRTFELYLPMPTAITVGNAFSVVAGCNKTFETCRTKFDNVLNFRGFPHVPNDDRRLRFPNRLFGFKA